ncbi:MAG: PLD nuclease N-terminal domain-containing protein [Candidatus Hodarchaeales archaeon]|jgi:beta-lactamase regulating signal transducer with metallopeptidase domain
MQEFSQELLLLIIPILILQILLIIIAIRDWLKEENKNIPNRLMWLLIILFISAFGPIIYFLAAPRHDSDLEFDEETNWG